MNRSPNAKHYRDAKKSAEQLYKAGVTDAEQVGQNVGVRAATVMKWIKTEGWAVRDEESRELQEQIEEAADNALLTALKAYKKDPVNKDLQSLNSMLKAYLERRKPDRKTLEYIIKFQEDVVEFCMVTGNEVLRKEYQANLINLSEFLRKKYA